MTHDPDHDQRAMSPSPDGSNGLHDPRLSQAYRDARRGPQEQIPWELRGTSGSRTRSSTGPRSGPSTTTRVIIALVLVAALIVPLIGRW